MHLKEILKIVDGTLLNNTKLNKKVKSIKFDSRKIENNDLYIAIIGKNKDGHEFIDEAIKKGAKGVIVSKDIKDKYNIPIIKVNDTLEALKKIACYKRKKFNGKVIAITGSVGKTTTKEIITNILKNKYKVVNNDGNKNNIYGLSETILNLKKDTEVLVVELGMNHRGEMETLSKICKPDISIITNIGTSHIGNLKSKRNIYKAKLEIIKGMNNGTIIVNSDDKYLKKIKLKNNIKIIKTGINNGDLKCLNIKKTNDSIEFVININNKNEEFKINLPGIHFVNNCLLAIITAINMKIEINDIKKSLENYESYNRRYKIYKNENITLIDDSYNSSYESLKANLSTLDKEESKLLIIGEVLELGKKSKKIHKKIGKLLEIPNSLIFIVGNNMKILSKKYMHFNNSEEVINYLENKNLNGYTIFIKGSNAVKLNLVSEYIMTKFDMK